jgi:hypothetical protein
MKPKGPNRIAKVDWDHLYRKKENLNISKYYIIYNN